jgi:aspartyl protease family protein
MNVRNISLTDNEIFPEIAEDKYYFHNAPYNWLNENGKFGITKEDLEPNSPILLRSIATSEYSFNDFKDNCLEMLDNLELPIKYERMGSYEISRWDLEAVALEYINNIFSSKMARKELFNYAIRNFKKIENKYPNSWKQNMINKIDECFLFTKTYQTKRSNYINLSKMEWCGENPNGQMRSDYNGFAYKIGYFESFIFRRIEYNKIPIQEINSYLMIMKTTLLESLSENNYSNYKDVYINNGEIILSDLLVNGKGVTIKIWNKATNKQLSFNSFSHIKCLQEDGKNYYMIYQNGKGTLINSKLEIVNETITKKSLDRDMLLDIYCPIGKVETINSAGDNKTGNRVNMIKKNGVFYIPTLVNGIPMQFIFDTGASVVSISLTEALFLFKNGKLAKSDILGKQYFSDAKGEISVGTKIILREIKIGNKTIKNIEASIVNNTNAPLLIGQSALEKLGKITFDTNNKILSFD